MDYEVEGVSKENLGRACGKKIVGLDSLPRWMLWIVLNEENELKDIG